MSSKVPDELWLETFTSMSHETLRSVSLTHHDFCRITRPLLFTHFDFHPYAAGTNSALLLPPAVEVAKALDCLEFWSSDEIAPLVRSCDVTPMSQGPFYEKPTEPYVLLDAFFERILRFTGLQRLTTSWVEFSSMAMSNLCRMPSLTNLYIERCRAERGEPEPVPQALSLSSFSIHHGLRRNDGLSHWVPSLHPQHLRELDLSCNPCVFGDIETIPTFPLVHRLSMAMNLATMVRNRAIMAKFPAVRVFTMHGWGSLEDGSQPAARHHNTPFPALEEYIGTYKTLSLFLAPANNITRVTIVDGIVHGVIAQLERADSIANITAFRADFGETTNILQLCALFSLLPRLTALRLCISTGNPYGAPFFHALADTAGLPPTLEHLALSWAFDQWIFDLNGFVSRPPSATPDQVHLRDAFLARCPALKTMWFDGHTFLYHWRKGIDRPGVQVFANNPDAARPFARPVRRVLGDALNPWGEVLHNAWTELTSHRRKSCHMWTIV
ncbi:hypothetical protein C8R47DRAFT_1312714 [Mycena vitilis]|nr:hypothetical protein C8R47DRAFT_1312714 [Mycena vitilis]